MMRGYLKILTLKALKHSEKTGYGLIKYIEECTGHKPSFGSIYPLLDSLSKKNLTTYKEEDKKKIYKLTKKGEKELENLMQKKQQMVTNIEESVRIFNTLTDNHNKQDIEFNNKVLSLMKEGKINIEKVPPEMQTLKKIILELVLTGKSKTQRKDVSKILNNTIKELKKIR